MRITLTRILSTFLISTVLLIFWIVLRETINQNTGIVRICKRSEEFQTDLHDLAFRLDVRNIKKKKLIMSKIFIYYFFYRTHSILTKFALTHFLCYGALWGQIRLSKTLPWETDVEICVLNEEITAIEEAQIYRAFQKNGLIIQYLSSDGVYVITDPTFEEGRIELYVFELNIMVKVNFYT